MSVRVRRHPAVEDDILDIAAWIGRDSREQAIRFLEAVEETIDGLRFMPTKGSLKGLRGRFAGVRTWAVHGFPNHLIFYEARPTEIYVYTVRHGSRRYVNHLRERRG